MKKLFWLLLLIPTLALGASGDTVIDGQPVESLTAGQVVVTSPTRTLVTNTGTTAAQISALTHGGNVDALHSHTNTSVSVTHASTTGQTANDHHDQLHAADHVNGTDDIQSATNAQKGLATSAQIAAIEANMLKETNVVTNLSEGTATNTTVDVNSSDGTNATLVSASTSRAGILTKAKFDEIVANSAFTAIPSTVIGSGTNLSWSGNTLNAADAYVGTVTSVATTAPITGGTITNSGTIAITMEGDLVTTAPLTGAADNILPGSGTKATLGITIAKDLVAGTGLSGGENNVLPGADADTTLTLEKLGGLTVSGTGMSGGGVDVLAGDDTFNTTVTLTVAKDLVVSGTGMSGGENDVFPGADADVNVTLTVAKDIVAGTDLNGGADNVLPGSDSDVTINLNSIISADTTGNAATATVAVKYIETGANPYVTISGGITNGQIAIIKAIDNTTSIRETGNIVLAGSTSFDMNTGDTLTCVYDSSDNKWRETSRSFAF